MASNYKEPKLNKNDIQAMYNALGALPVKKKGTAKKAATKKTKK